MTRHNTGVCVMAAQAGADVHVIDVGIDADPIPGLIDMKVARSSGNIAQGPAMSAEQAQSILMATIRYTRQLAEQGVTLFGVGELGMANTTPAAAMVSVLTDSEPEAVVGVGANLPQTQLGHKVEVVRRAIAVNQPNADDGLDVLTKVGGYDLLGMTGVMLGAASCGLPVVLDGFLSYASALAACRIAPGVKPYLIPSHFSAEKGRVSRSRISSLSRICTWRCAWARAAALRWRCISSSRPAPCITVWGRWRVATSSCRYNGLFRYHLSQQPFPQRQNILALRGFFGCDQIVVRAGQRHVERCGEHSAFQQIPRQQFAGNHHALAATAACSACVSSLKVNPA